MDSKIAFLYGGLNDKIYMRVPDGVSAKQDGVCKLNKALYGLKQESRCWFELLDETIKRNTRLEIDVFIF